MKKKFLYILVLIGITVGCNQSINKIDEFELISTPVFSETRIDIIKKYTAGLPKKTEFSIAIIKNDSIYFYGFKKKQNTWRNLENCNSIFEVGSITKTFTGALFTLLEQDSIIRFDEPIKNSFDFILNESSKDSIEITFLHLANHISGLPRDVDFVVTQFQIDPYSSLSKFDSLQMINYLQNEMSLNSIPGKTFEYSNIGFGLLGHLIEIKTGLEYEFLLKERIFKRYDMHNSATNISEIHQDLVRGLKPNGDFSPPLDCGMFFGAGSVLSTPVDIVSYVNHCLNGDSLFLTQSNHRFPFTDTTSSSLGWAVKEIFTGDTWYWTGGVTFGYSSFINFNIESGNAVIVMSNVSAIGDKVLNVLELCDKLMLSIELE